MFFRLGPKQLLRARASEYLDAEQGRIVESMKKILTHRGQSGWDDWEWDIYDGVWDLEKPQRTIIAVRFGEPMTLANIGDGLGMYRESVRQLELRAIEQIEAHVVEAREKASAQVGGRHDRESRRRARIV